MIDTNWMTRGKCRDLPPETFYPDSSVGVARARRICARCPVKDQCLEHALRYHIADGIWGGSSERQRLGLQRERRELNAKRADAAASSRGRDRVR